MSYRETSIRMLVAGLVSDAMQADQSWDACLDAADLILELLRAPAEPREPDGWTDTVGEAMTTRERVEFAARVLDNDLAMYEEAERIRSIYGAVPTPPPARDGALAQCLLAIRWWAAQEDGIPEEVWPAYVNGCTLLGWAVDGTLHTDATPTPPAAPPESDWCCEHGFREHVRGSPACELATDRARAAAPPEPQRPLDSRGHNVEGNPASDAALDAELRQWQAAGVEALARIDERMDEDIAGPQQDAERLVDELTSLAAQALTFRERDILDRAAAALRAARGTKQRLRELVREATHAGTGHGHWDPTMRHGAGCQLCIVRREANDRIEAELRALAATDTEGGDG